MTYPYLRPGDVLPTAGVLQKLLNARVDVKLKPDGHFGAGTAAAVRTFQSGRGLAPDSIVGKITWPRLSRDADALAIIDCIDVFDEQLFDKRVNESIEVYDVKRVGGNPIVIGGMSNGVEQAVSEIVQRARGQSVFLLRFHGHGSPGYAGISSGTGMPGDNRDSSRLGNFSALRSTIGRLRGIFGPYGCVQFMHCSTGRGHAGRQLLNAIARELGVPVTGALHTQFGGGGVPTFRFEGPTYTAVPSRGTLRDWCQNLPDFVGVGVR